MPIGYTGSIGYIDPEVIDADPHRRPKNNSYKEKAGLKIEREIEAFIDRFSLNRSCFLTLNFLANMPPSAAPKTIKRMEKLLAKYFEAYYWVLAIKRHGCHRRVHIHAVVASREDLRTGLNPQIFASYRAIAARAKLERRRMTKAEMAERRSLVKNITTNKALKALWSILRQKLPKLGLAPKMPFELMPIYKDALAVGHYMGANLRESHLNKLPKDGRLHLFGKTKNAPVVVKGISNISLFTKGSKMWRQLLDQAAQSVGMNEEDMKKEFGFRWQWKMRSVCIWWSECARAGAVPAADALRSKMFEVLGEPLSWYRHDTVSATTDLRAAIEASLLQFNNPKKETEMDQAA